MNKINQRLSVIAYYLSKYDLKAVHALGFHKITEAFRKLSDKLGNGNDYLKRRRDEFDVLTGSKRKGYIKRKPRAGVKKLHEGLKGISFDDFTAIVNTLVSDQQEILVKKEGSQNAFETNIEAAVDEPAVLQKEDQAISETDFEDYINTPDTNARRERKLSEHYSRIYNKSVPDNLKKLYQNKCQICQYTSEEFGVSIVEAHHIIPFCESANNNAENIVILCPNHHRLLHKVDVSFDRDKEEFVLCNGKRLRLELSFHFGK